MNAKEHHPRTKQGYIIEVWEKLDCESVGAKELQEIQSAVQEKFGGAESPAAIARTLADEGAVLRHPEVLECDARWREKHSRDADFLERLRVDSLLGAPESIKNLEILRRKLKQEANQSELRQLMETVQRIRQDRLLVARSKVVAERTRSEAREIAAWLEVWLNAPELFSNWLELRLNSPGFQKQFRKG